MATRTGERIQASWEEDDPLSPADALRRRIRSHRGLLIGFGVILFMAILAVLAPWLAAHGPYEQTLANRLLPPAWEAGGRWEYPLGTDHLGRDYLSRLLHGSRISLAIGMGAATIGCLIGVPMGICAGYFGGRVDHVINFILTCKLAMPGLVLTMSLVFLIGPSVFVVMGIIGVLHWSYYLVVTRAATMQIRQIDYIAAARAVGSSKRQLIFYEILPNLLNQIIVIFTFEVGIAILSEAALSFLGVGIQAPTPSWGLMIAEGRSAMFYRPWLVILPGVFLFTLVIGTNLMGDGIRDVTAPENRN